jgi:hypothetical protein
VTHCLARALFVVLQIATVPMAAAQTVDQPADDAIPTSIWTRLKKTPEGEARFQNHGYVAGEASRLALSGTFLNADRTLFRPPLDTQLVRVVDDLAVALPAAVNLTARLAAEWDHDNSASVVHGQVRELYLMRSHGEFNFFLGRRILKWTNGYAFSPAGLIDPNRDPSDPSDRLGRLAGRDLAQVDWFRGKQTVTAVLTFPFRTRSDGGDRVFAVRYDVLLHGADIAASAALASKSKSRGAVSVSYVAGRSLELHAEASAARGSNFVYPRAILDRQQHTLFGTDYFSPVFENDRKLRVRALAGANFTFSGGLNLIAEYYHTDEGLTGQQWDNFLGQSSYASELNRSGQFPPVFGGLTLPQVNLLQGLSYLRSQEIRRDYAFVRLARSFADEKVAAEALTVINLEDGSLLVAPEVSIKIGIRTSLYVRGVVFRGGRGSQYGNVAFASTVTAGLRAHF